jgi:uncharacterized protein
MRWIGLLVLFLSAYGALHLYMLIKMRRALYLEGLSFILVAAILMFLMFAPIQAQILTAYGGPSMGPAVTWMGFLWMGYIFLFVCIAVPLDLYHLTMNAFRHLFNVDWTGLMLMRRNNLMLAAVVAAGLMVYGGYSAYRVETERVTLYSPKIPDHIDRIRIVLISDLHLGTMIYPGRLRPVLKAVREAQPDILVSTGDLIDGDPGAISDWMSEFKALQAPLGKFAVTGNHEYYHGIADSLALTEKAGFRILQNTAIVVQDIIAIAGVDDPAGGGDPDAAEAAALKDLSQDRYTVLLKHRPEVNAASIERFDLQLSGHSHGGQIFPFNYLVRLVYPMLTGLYQVGPETFFYASRGTGTLGPPVRLFIPPEITIIDLLPAP